jgi:superfamily II DNA/RNA helicase
LDNIKRSHYQKVRKIQSTVIPLILAGKKIPLDNLNYIFVLGHDLKVQAETGAGKSAAFLVPIIHTILAQKFESTNDTSQYNCRFGHPTAVIIEPSRELAIQVFEQALKLTENTDVKVSICFGEFGKHQSFDSIYILFQTTARIPSSFGREAVTSW